MRNYSLQVSFVATHNGTRALLFHLRNSTLCRTPHETHFLPFPFFVSASCPCLPIPRRGGCDIPGGGGGASARGVGPLGPLGPRSRANVGREGGANKWPSSRPLNIGLVRPLMNRGFEARPFYRTKDNQAAAFSEGLFFRKKKTEKAPTGVGLTANIAHERERPR